MSFTATICLPNIFALLIVILIASVKCSKECHECRPTTRDTKGQKPVGIVLDVHLTEFGLTYVDKFAGSCNCSDGNIELFVYPQGGICNNAVPYGHIFCQNFSKFCALDANGDFYTPAMNYPGGLNFIFYYAICDVFGEDCKAYISMGQYGLSEVPNFPVPLALRSQSDQIWQSPANYFPSGIGPEAGGLLSVSAISCHGCDAIRLVKCKGKFVKA